MKILIVTRCFFPHGDASSSVVENLAEALTQKGCTVKILAMTADQKDTDIRLWGPCQTRNIYVATWKTPERLRRELKDRPLSASWTFFRKTMSKVYGKMMPAYRKLSMNPQFVKAYKKAIGQELQASQYDLCLVTLMPQEAIYAALRVCRSNTPITMYQLDTYWNNQLCPEKYQEERKEFERKAIQECAFSIVTPIIHKTDSEIYPELIHKIIPAEFPMIKPLPSFEEKTQEDGKTHCVFLGTLYPELRPPEKVVACISQMKDRDIVFDFYGDRQELIRKCPEYEENKDRIRLHGRVSSDEAESVRANADVLVNIDNTNLFQVPSKIFEYFSTGKPILNFYFNPDSPILPYLERYPLCLNIPLGQEPGKEGMAQRMEAFIRESAGKHVPFEMVEAQYRESTPAYVADQFLSAFRNAGNGSESGA